MASLIAIDGVALELRRHITFATLFTVLSAVVGFLAKYANDLSTERRKDKLDRINTQLRQLYGPLYACERAHSIAWGVFRNRYRHGGAYFPPNTAISEEDKQAWRLWITEVFLPMRERMETAVMDNGDLLLEDAMPDCLLQLCAHVEAFRPIVKRWENKDFAEHIPPVEFPREDLRVYLEESYRLLKTEQQKLLGKLRLDARNGIPAPKGTVPLNWVGATAINPPTPEPQETQETHTPPATG